MDRVTQTAMKSIITSKLEHLKFCFRKSFYTKYTDRWMNEEGQINALVQELKKVLNQDDSKPIQEAVNQWKLYLLIDANWKSQRISEVNLNSFLNTSDGRFYGGAIKDFMRLLQKMDMISVPSEINSNHSPCSITSSLNINNTNNNQSNTSNMLTIEHPITGAKLQVANQDFSREMFWQDGKKACGELGGGWRVPTIEELKTIYERFHKRGLGNFKDDFYWSNSEDNEDYAWGLNFSSGCVGHGGKSNPALIRAVKNL